MSSHTPGPWFQVGAWVEIESDDVADICTCHTEDFGQAHLGRSAEEMMANACLIAAAPDLLEALEMVRDADNDRAADGMETIPDIARAKIDRAIAKAKGA